jgi:DNA-binding NarL/FixJ family response regulator
MSKMPIRVMLADDHQAFLQGLAALIQSAGIELSGVANDRDHLLEMILADPPDVAIVDIGMPGVNIPQLLAVLREQQVRTAVLVLTGDDGEFLAELMSAGARGYMLKEHAFEDLLTAIRTVSAGKRFISPQVAAQLLGPGNAPGAASPSRKLTARQLEILRLVASGDTSKRIAHKLSIHIKTVDNHRRMLRDRLSVRSTAEMIRVAKEDGLI